MLIYKATNLINNKIYIGQTTLKLEERKDGHFRETRSSKKKNTYFHNAIAKYGESNFIFEQIDTANTINELNEKEIYWISFYNSTNKSIGYNLDTGGSNCSKSEFTKIKIGELKKINWKDENLSQKMKAGLVKATEAWKAISKERQVALKCKNCGIIFYLPEYMTKIRKYCSLKCANTDKDNYMKGILKANESNNIRIKERKSKIKKDVEEWSLNNIDVILNSSYNKVTTNLKEMINIIQHKYDIKDIRSISNATCGTSSRKEFLNWLKSFVKIYADLV